MKICIISDTHELESEVEISPCDLLIHCGDWSFFGRSIRAMEAFNDWLGEQPARHKVITAGNHEYPVAAHPDRWRRRMSNATLLLNESANIAGVRIWGSPVNGFEGGAFGIGDEAVREKLYSAISEGTDILANSVTRIRARGVDGAMLVWESMSPPVAVRWKENSSVPKNVFRLLNGPRRVEYCCTGLQQHKLRYVKRF